jgi:adenylate cyclase
MDVTGRDVRDQLIARGLLDPASDLAAQRYKALKLLLDRGASLDDLEQNAHDLGYLASLIMNGGPATMSRRELADRCGVPVDVLTKLSLAIGLPDPGPDALSANEDDIALVQVFVAAAQIFGDAATLQLARVVGTATARMADAVASTYRTAVAVQALETDPSGLSMVEANLELEALLPLFMTAVQQLIRRHVAASTRPITPDDPRAYDATTLCVGFADLVGSTSLAQRLGPQELNATLAEFDAAACDIVVAAGGRVVKLIGDEIMFTHPHVPAAVGVARQILAFVREHSILTAGRCGLAYGTVLTRDGDCFGPTVNLAARLTGAAGVDEVLLDATTAELLGLPAPVAARELTLKGIEDPVRVVPLPSPTAAD